MMCREEEKAQNQLHNTQINNSAETPDGNLAQSVRVTTGRDTVHCSKQNKRAALTDTIIFCGVNATHRAVLVFHMIGCVERRGFSTTAPITAPEQTTQTHPA